MGYALLVDSRSRAWRHRWRVVFSYVICQLIKRMQPDARQITSLVSNSTPCVGLKCNLHGRRRFCFCSSESVCLLLCLSLRRDIKLMMFRRPRPALAPYSRKVCDICAMFSELQGQGPRNVLRISLAAKACPSEVAAGMLLPGQTGRARKSG